MAPHPDRDEHYEGREAAGRFEHTLARVLTVSKTELAKREAAYQKTRRTKKRRAANR
jgi:hypothetical protein